MSDSPSASSTSRRFDSRARHSATTMSDHEHLRRHSTGLFDGNPRRALSSVQGREIKAPSRPRPLAQAQNADDDELDVAENNESHPTTAQNAVESAADALLQRLRSRARVAKPERLEEDNQQERSEVRAHTTSAITQTPRAVARNSPVTSISATGTRLPRTQQSAPTLSMPICPSMSAAAEWRTAAMARASLNRAPGEQVDLPDFMDDESSDDRYADPDTEDDVASDGEVVGEDLARQPVQQMRRFNELAVDRFGHDDASESDQDDANAETSLSNRDVNVSKAIALRNSMVRNMVRLGFDEDLARAALDAGVLEIEQYDADCELAYVDVFITLVKLVCDAHQDITPPNVTSLPTSSQAVEDGSPRAHFKWPVFDMAQFEFGNSRPGTCFDSVCVLINLPKVAMDRTEELMEILSSCLFERLGDPIQVLIPSVSATGRTKGHAFLEFDDPDMARACASAIDGLTWGRGPYGRIRARMFRQYQVKSPVPPTLGNDHGASDIQGGDGDASQYPRRPRPPIRRGIYPTPPPQLDDTAASTADPNRESRELSREDLSASEISSASWNTGSRVSLGIEDANRYRGRLNRGDRQWLHQSSSSLEDMAVFYRSHEDSAMQLGELRLSSDDDGDSSGTESDVDLDTLPFQETDTSDPSASAAISRARRIELLRQSLPPLPLDGPLGVPRNPSSQVARLNGQSSSGVDIEGPWKAYCEELIARNREMQEQVSYARRRIAALGHNNQKLHLLIDRMERDRDGLLFENDLLQTQLHGYEDHERQQEALMKELAALRRRMKRRDQRIERGLLESGLNMGPGAGVAVELEGGVMSLDDLEEQLVQNIVSSRRLEDLKEWEQMLEGSLMRVRSIKEEIAVELQKKLLAQQSDECGAQDHKLCVVCLSNEKSILCLPCRHLCLCQDCSQHAELDKCPICRLAVENMLLVYA